MRIFLCPSVLEINNTNGKLLKIATLLFINNNALHS